MTEIDTGTDTVLGEVRDRVGVITLNRPERRNALHPDMYDAVPRLLERFFDDDDVGCVLVTAAGNAFCAGGDVRDGRRRRERSDAPAALGGGRGRRAGRVRAHGVAPARRPEDLDRGAARARRRGRHRHRAGRRPANCG